MTRRLLFGYLGIALFVLVALEVPLGVQNQRNERANLGAKLEHDALVLAARPQPAFVARYARDTGARVVLVDPRGIALLDTAGGTGRSFASRPEFRAALGGRTAVGTRHSSTLRTDLLYVAMPVVSGGAIRLTFPTSEVDERILRYWLLLAAIAAVVLAAATVVGLNVARFATGPLRRLERAAAAVGEGDLDARAPVHAGPDEVKSLARVFNSTVAKLGRALRSQEEFAADASHELRTPLTALRLRLENGDVDGALREVELLSDRVEGLLTMARAEAPSAPAVAADTAAIVHERIEHWRPLAEERGIALVAETSPARALAAPERVGQVLDNLIANALDAAPGGTTVTVSARGAELRVRDQGPGLTPEQRIRAFDRFWRGGDGDGGSGLGLAIVRRLVEADEGDIELVEAPGGGLEAVVRLRSA